MSDMKEILEDLSDNIDEYSTLFRRLKQYENLYNKCKRIELAKLIYRMNDKRIVLKSDAKQKLEQFLADNRDEILSFNEDFEKIIRPEDDDEDY